MFGERCIWALSHVLPVTCQCGIRSRGIRILSSVLDLQPCRWHFSMWFKHFPLMVTTSTIYLSFILGHMLHPSQFGTYGPLIWELVKHMSQTAYTFYDIWFTHPETGEAYIQKRMSSLPLISLTWMTARRYFVVHVLCLIMFSMYKCRSRNTVPRRSSHEYRPMNAAPRSHHHEEQTIKTA